MEENELPASITTLLRLRHGDGGGSRAWDHADYLHAFGNVRDALLYSALFAPEFVEIEGFVFLKEFGVQLKGGWSEVAIVVRRARETSTEALQNCVNSFNWL